MNKVRCEKCNGRKYIELDKIGLRVCTCPDCGGTGEEELPPPFYDSAEEYKKPKRTRKKKVK